ncbi:MAG: hypothetical protein WBW04_15710 [Nitrolancea sp.]
MTRSPIQITNVDVLIAESYPPQISVSVTGIIPDSCTTVQQPEVNHDGTTFTITIMGERPTGMVCAQVATTYQKSIALGTLDPGDYTVSVNGVSKDFTVS